MSKLTVAEYAEKHSITKQAVYKKLKRLNIAEEEKNGKKIIFIIEEEQEQEQKCGNGGIQPDSTRFKPQINPDLTQNQPILNPVSTPIQPEINPDIQPDSTQEEDKVNSSIIEILKEQLAEKDRQIERLQEAAKEKDQQLKEQFDRLTSLLLRSQELEALTHKLLGQGEEQEEEGKTEVIQDKATEQEQPKKQSFWKRLFS